MVIMPANIRIPFSRDDMRVASVPRTLHRARQNPQCVMVLVILQYHRKHQALQNCQMIKLINCQDVSERNENFCSAL